MQVRDGTRRSPRWQARREAIVDASAHLFARNMRQFAILASLIAGISAFIGFWIAYQWDYPIGPTDVVLLGFVYAVTWCLSWSMKYFKTD